MPNLPNLLNFSWLNFRHKLYRRLVYGLMAVVIVLGIGVTTAQPSQARWFDLLIRGAQVYQLSNMSDAQEVDLGSGINRQLFASGGMRRYRNNSLNAYVDGIGQTLAAVSDRSNIPYTFQIVEDRAVNAFATMGGFVYVTTGLMRAADNEAELASVLGHEIGHIVNRDAVQQMRQAAIAQGVTGALGLNRDRLVNIGTQIALQLPASRSAEYAADQIGFHTLGRAGYNQAAMVTFMQKLVRQGSPPEFLSTHPDAGNRVNALRQMNNEAAVPEATSGLNANAYRSQISALR